MPLGYEHGVTIDASSDWRAYVEAITVMNCTEVNNKPPLIPSKSNLRTQVANGQLEKPKAVATPKILLETILCRHDDFNTASHSVALFESQQCSFW